MEHKFNPNEKVKITRNPDENDGIFIYGDNFEKALARIYPHPNQEEIAKRFVTALNMHDELISTLKTISKVYDLPTWKDKNQDHWTNKVLELIKKSEEK